MTVNLKTTYTVNTIMKSRNCWECIERGLLTLYGRGTLGHVYLRTSTAPIVEP